MLEAIAVAFAVVFVAELGDKSQLMAFTFGTRFAARWVLVGILVAFGVINIFSVGVGAAIGELVSPRTATLLAGIVFLGAAVFIWLDDDDSPDDEDVGIDGADRADDPEAPSHNSDGGGHDAASSRPNEGGSGPAKQSAPPARRALSVILTVASAVGLAELGDKTMFVTAGLAANGASSGGGAVATWIGATLGETAAAAIGLLAGRSIGSRLSPRVLRIVSTVMFVAFGLVMVVSALLPR